MMADPRALEHGFDGHIPQTDQDIALALQSGLLSLDANVLLNFYRYSPKAREALVEVLGAAGDRVWVSHQAAREFWRNRCNTIEKRNEATQQVRAALDKSKRSLLDAVDSWAKQTAVSGEVKQQVRDMLANGLEKASDIIGEETASAGSISYSPDSDSVLETLQALLAANVGAPLDPTEHDAAVTEGARRVREGIPPGFRDAEKLEDGGPDGASGDYLVWLQSMKEAERRGLPLVIITGDEKEDWWWRHKSSLLGPRPELVAEFAQRCGNRLYMLRPVELTEHADALAVTVSSEAKTDVARAETETRLSRWNRRAVVELLRRLEAEGKKQADVIRFAADRGGVVTREEVYQICEYNEERMLRGFTKPAARVTLALQDEGFLDGPVEPVLTPHYDTGVTAVRFEIPLDVVEILSDEEDETPNWAKS
jgi:hypothetical protein